MASTNIDVIIGAVTSGRPLRPDGVSQLLRSVKVEVKLMAFPGEARSTGLGIVVGVAEVEEIKPAPWIPTATALPTRQSCLGHQTFPNQRSSKAQEHSGKSCSRQSCRTHHCAMFDSKS